MTRPLRIQFSGGLYHVTARGNGRLALFADAADCERFLGVLAAATNRYRLLCHAYCLMGNHYHLLLETPKANLSAAMRQLNGVYAQHFNRRHERPGHVTEGRFHARLVDRDAYLLEVCRYIVLNPVRAGLVSHPRDWPWSSYRATAGEAPSPGFLTADWALSLHGATSRAQAQRNYTRFVMAGLQGTDPPWDPEQIPFPLNGPSAVQTRSHIARAASQTEIPRRERHALRPTLEELFADASGRGDRDARSLRAVHEHGYTLRAIAEFLGVHYVTVSRSLARAEAVRRTPTRMSYCKT